MMASAAAAVSAFPFFFSPMISLKENEPKTSVSLWHLRQSGHLERHQHADGHRVALGLLPLLGRLHHLL
jgi:hypothetical protein